MFCKEGFERHSLHCTKCQAQSVMETILSKKKMQRVLSIQAYSTHNDILYFENVSSKKEKKIMKKTGKINRGLLSEPFL